MSLRSSGFYCDICNKAMVTEMLLNKPLRGFSINGFQETFHGHDDCNEVLKKAVEEQDFSMLPPGPVLECFNQIIAHNKKFDQNSSECGSQPKGEK